ncbi:MAG: hypothetical protein GQ470_04495 [Gammaproteobacteria bacterium]|nr:hypothetical protein [Gammaproteobacteria bacterium]
MTDMPRDTLTQRQRYWLNHIQQCKESGQSLRAYAKSNGLNCNSLYTAHSKLKSKGVITSKKPSPKFQQLTVQRASLPSTVKITCPNGFIVEAHAEVSSLQQLLQMVSALQ